MGKMFVTKLPVSVENNGSLPYVDSISFHVEPGLIKGDVIAAHMVTIRGTGKDSLTIETSDGLAHLIRNTTNSDLESVDTSKAVRMITESGHTDPTYYTFYIMDDASYDIIIRSKYLIRNIVSQNTGSRKRCFYFSIDDLKYSNIQDLYMVSSVCTGDISSFADKTNLRRINLNGSNVTGDVGELSNCTALTFLSLSGSNVTGDVGELFDNIAALKTARTMIFSPTSSMTLNGEALTVKEYTVTFTEDGTYTIA